MAYFLTKTLDLRRTATPTQTRGLQWVLMYVTLLVGHSLAAFVAFLTGTIDLSNWSGDSEGTDGATVALEWVRSRACLTGVLMLASVSHTSFSLGRCIASAAYAVAFFLLQGGCSHDLKASVMGLTFYGSGLNGKHNCRDL